MNSQTTLAEVNFSSFELFFCFHNLNAHNQTSDIFIRNPLKVIYSDLREQWDESNIYSNEVETECKSLKTNELYYGNIWMFRVTKKKVFCVCAEY